MKEKRIAITKKQSTLIQKSNDKLRAALKLLTKQLGIIKLMKDLADYDAK
jgi:hypothetical protein